MTDDINKKPVAGISAAAAVTITTNSLNTSSAQHGDRGRGGSAGGPARPAGRLCGRLRAGVSGGAALNTVTGRDEDDDCDVAGAAMGEAAPCQGGGGDQGRAEGS